MLLFIAIGFGAGILSGLFGIGGGIVIVPALLLLLRFPPHLATGTSLGVFLLPVGILGAYQYWKNGNIDVRASLLIALGLFFGAFLGGTLAQQLPAAMLRKAFAVFLVLVAVQLWRK